MSEPEKQKAELEAVDADPLARGQRSLRHLLPILLAPLALAVAIVLSLVVSGWRVRHSVIAQVEPRWVPGERLAARAQLLDGERDGIKGATLAFAVEAGGSTYALLDAKDGPEDGLTQGGFTVPDLAPGPAEAIFELRAPGREPVRERVPVEVVAARTDDRGEHTISSSNLNWGDDTDPQPEKLRINARALGRLLAGFDNTLMVRVTDLEGRAHAGEVEVALLEGEFMGQVGASEQSPVLVRARPDRLGLLTLEGPFTSDVLAIEVRAFAAVDPGDDDATSGSGAASSEKPGAAPSASADARGDAASSGSAADSKADASAGSDVGATAPGDGEVEGPTPLAARKLRMVSYAGAVRAYVEPLAARPGEEVLLGARPLRAKRPVYVDIHDTTGAWIDTIAPPFVGREPPRPWVVPAGVDGVVQIEAYSFINAPGESAEVARLQVTTRPSDAPASLEPLIELQRERLEIPRVEKDFDAALERAHLDRITKAELSAEEVATARAWLLGTLPIEVHEPPAAVATRAREEASVRARKHTWNAGIRLFLLAGGGLFLLVATILIARSYGRVARATQRALRPDGEAPDEDALFEEQVAIRAAQRAGLARGAALIVTMALGVVLTVVVLDRLVWEFNDDAPAPAAVDAPIDPG